MLIKFEEANKSVIKSSNAPLINTRNEIYNTQENEAG
jgi:hypothetical protein